MGRSTHCDDIDRGNPPPPGHRVRVCFAGVRVCFAGVRVCFAGVRVCFAGVRSRSSLPAAQVPGSLPAAQVPGSVPAAQTPASAEIRFLELLNSERAARGLSRLARSTALDAVARSWSTTMSVNGLAHRGDLAVQMTLSERGWRRAGENVGYGSDVEALHRAFVNSPAHFDNVVGDWTKVGVGVVVVGDTTWVTFNFVKSPPAVVRKSRKATRVEK
jgi:uncharacterized protein YkwD